MSTTDTAPPPASPTVELPRLRTALRQRQFAEVLESTQALLAEYPRHRDLLLFRAIALRGQRRIPEALAALQTLERAYPQFSRLHEERGRCFVELKQAPEAITAFTRA